jgi:hypothetical protein
MEFGKTWLNLSFFPSKIILKMLLFNQDIQQKNWGFIACFPLMSFVIVEGQ